MEQLLTTFLHRAITSLSACATRARPSALVHPTPSDSTYRVNLTFAFNNLVRPYAPSLDPGVYDVPMDAEEFGGLPTGQVSHTLQAEMLVVHQAQKPCTTLLEQIG